MGGGAQGITVARVHSLTPTVCQSGSLVHTSVHAHSALIEHTLVSAVVLSTEQRLIMEFTS